MKKIISILLFLSLMTACVGNGDNVELTSFNWSLLSMPGYGALPANVSLEFDPESGNLAGSSGCNRYFTVYQITGNRLTVDAAIGATMMGCPEAQMKLEQDFLRQLATVSTFEVSGNQLVLKVVGGELVFQAVE